MLFRGLTAPRCAASIFCGVVLACLPTASPLWLLAALLIILTRTHIPAVLLAWCAGSLLAVPLSACYTQAGEAVLRAHTAFWSAIFQLPVICYLELHRARVMGSVVCGAIAGAAAAVASLLAFFFWRLRHPVRTEAL